MAVKNINEDGMYLASKAKQYAVLVDSRWVAEKLGKTHNMVLRDIRNLLGNGGFSVNSLKPILVAVLIGFHCRKLLHQRIRARRLTKTAVFPKNLTSPILESLNTRRETSKGKEKHLILCNLHKK